MSIAKPNESAVEETVPSTEENGDDNIDFSLNVNSDPLNGGSALSKLRSSGPVVHPELQAELTDLLRDLPEEQEVPDVHSEIEDCFAKTGSFHK